jgi:G3E family GTPase
MTDPEPTPVNLITGFLGSGKTTLLRRLLASPALARTAVLVNELGEIGLDHLLLREVDERTVVLPSGCVCCSIRSDLSAAMRDLLSQRERGLLPAFDRLAIETTGLADPAPILFTITADPVIRHHVRLGNVVTVVDGVTGRSTLARHPESVAQVAVADRLVISKTDLADADGVEALRRELRRYNPAAPLLDAAAPLAPDDLLTRDLYDAPGRLDDARRWSAAGGESGAGGDRPSRHPSDIGTFTLTFTDPMDWTAFGIWLSMLLHRHGERVLRVKGLLQVAGTPTPVLVQGVQHLVHPPMHLDRWPTPDHRTRLVFIVRDLDRRQLERSLAAFNRLGARTRSAA